MLTIGTDTYISLEDCDTYLYKNYLSTDAKYLQWKSLFGDDSDKEVLLRQAAKIIDSQPLQGFKVSSTQTMAFPRIFYTEHNNDKGWYSQPVVPSEVGFAQCEIAIQLAQGKSERLELQRQGVKSFSIGNLSESYTGKQSTIPCYEAKQLLEPFMNGGFRI